MNENDQKTGMNGPWPGKPGVIPVTSGRADDANIITRNYLDSIQIEEHLIGAEKASLSTVIFNRQYDSPVMTPAFSHLNHVGMKGRRPMTEYAEAAKSLHILNWVGMETDETYAEIAATGADTVRIIKPFADHDLIREQIAFAISHGAIAVGIDIDHIFGTNGDYDVVDGHTMGPVTVEDMKEYVERAGTVPFVAKGVLSTQDANACLEAGVRGIFISHHHGRMPFAVPPVEVLQRIMREIPELKSKAQVFVDCHIDSGADAYKALALGADGVAVGRSILPALLQSGKDGVVKKVKTVNEELAMLMGYTGIPEPSRFNPSALWYGGEKM